MGRDGFENELDNAVGPDQLHEEDQRNAELDCVQHMLGLVHVQSEARSQDHTRKDEDGRENHIVDEVHLGILETPDLEDCAADQEWVRYLCQQATH